MFELSFQSSNLVEKIIDPGHRRSVS
jgi:hypothetical protein